MKWVAVEHHPDYNSSDIKVFGPFETEEECKAAIPALERLLSPTGIILLAVPLYKVVIE